MSSSPGIDVPRRFPCGVGRGLLASPESIEPAPQFVEACISRGRVVGDELGLQELVNELIDGTPGVPRQPGVELVS